MKTPFRLDDHPRRPHPLTPPPDAYFDKLPLRIMQRVQPAESPAAPLFGWLAALSAPVRTALASMLLLVAFVGTYFLTNSPVPSSSVTDGAVARTALPGTERKLAVVPEAEVVQYLLTQDDRLTLQDLADSPLADRDLVATFLPGSSAELEAALDEQPSVDIYL